MNKKTEPGSTPGEDVPEPGKSIVLVGLMGAGKSSVGKRVAGALNIPFVDSDSEIETAAGMSIPEIFEHLGEPAFRDGERRVISRLLSEETRIIATGGGAFIDPETRKEIKQNSISVWIRADIDVLWDRVRGRSGRPLLEKPNPRKILADLLLERSPVYAHADVVVDSYRKSNHEFMARSIIDAVLEYERGKIPEHPHQVRRSND